MYNIIEDDGSKGHLFLFKTDRELTYTVQFRSKREIAGKQRFDVDLALANEEVVKVVLDDKVRQTVVHIINQFSKNHRDSIISYVCDAGDDRQYGRHKKFKSWFNKEKSEELCYFDYELSEDGSKTYLIAAIYHPDYVSKHELRKGLMEYLDNKRD